MCYFRFMNVYYKSYRVKHMTKTYTDHIVATIARWLLGGFFVYSGVDNLLNLFITAERVGLPVMLVIIAAVLKLIFGTCIMLRYHTKYAAFALAVYMTFVSIMLYHPLTWAVDNFNQYIFLRNVAIVGGLLFVYAYSRGFSDWKEEFIPDSEKRLLHEHPHQPPRPHV